MDAHERVDWRISASISFLLLAVAVVSLRTPPVIQGPWAGIYVEYAPFWMLVVVSAVVALTWTGPRRRRHHSLAFVTAFAVTLVSVSLLWDHPYGPVDPWRHLRLIRTGQFDPVENVYPLFHLLVTVLSAATGRPAEFVLARIPVLATGLAVGFAAMLATSRRDGCPAFSPLLLLVPGVTFGFVARPFTLAMPFVLLAYWVALRSRGGTTWRTSAIALSVFVPLVYHHPFVTLLCLFVFASVQILEVTAGPNPGSLGEVAVYPATVALVLAFHLLLTSALGQHLLGSLIASLVTSAPADGPHQATLARNALGGFRAIGEALARGSYSLALSSIAGLGIATAIRSQSPKPASLVAFLAGSMTVVTFVGFTVFSPGGVGLFRLLSIAPIVAFPAVVRGVELLHGSSRNKRLLLHHTVVIVVLAVGLGVAFVTPAIGGVEYSVTDQEVRATDWLVEHDTEEVVAGRNTFVVMAARYGVEKTRRLSANDTTGSWTLGRREAEFSWRTARRSDDALYVVDGPSRVRVRDAVFEGAPLPFECLRTFRTTQSRVYDNADIRLYLRSRQRAPKCVE